MKFAWSKKSKQFIHNTTRCPYRKYGETCEPCYKYLELNELDHLYDKNDDGRLECIRCGQLWMYIKNPCKVEILRLLDKLDKLC